MSKKDMDIQKVHNMFKKLYSEIMEEYDVGIENVLSYNAAFIGGCWEVASENTSKEYREENLERFVASMKGSFQMGIENPPIDAIIIRKLNE